MGKTTLMNAVAGRVTPTNGQILWKGKDISSQSSHARAKNGIAYVPQGRQIFPLLTVQENLETGFTCLPHSQRRIDREIYDLFPILLVEQYFEFARNLADIYAVLDRGEEALSGDGNEMDEGALLKLMTV